MTITERTLKKWRKEALECKGRIIPVTDGGQETKLEWSDRILRLTQVLLDQYLVNKP